MKVAVPNDTTNEARALTLLEKNGFFKLKADAGLTATAKDIEEKDVYKRQPVHRSESWPRSSLLPAQAP